MHIFDSQIEFGNILPEFAEIEIKNEPMLFSASLDYALKVSGPITQSFLSSLPWDFVNHPSFILDSRSHMLMPGWYPCIPGWHHDDVPRRDSDGQPDYYHPAYRSQHAMVLINGDICPTEFAIGAGAFSDINPGEIYYQVWHPQVEQRIAEGYLNRLVAPTNKIIFFDDRSWHQGTQAKRGGWRFFIRATINTNRKHFNEIRNQVQVYLPEPFKGW